MQYILKKNPRSRSLRLRISSTGEAVVTAHPLTPNKMIESFVLEHQAWIEQQQHKIRTELSSLTEIREELWYRGERLPFRLQVNQQKKPKVTLDGGKIVVYSKSEDHQSIRIQLTKWYREQAEKYLPPKTLQLAEKTMNLPVNVSLRDQKTRWGSCSSRRTISLNWRLILVPEWVSEYIIFHELAHLRQMNHSKAFWLQVSTYCPDYKKAEKWLKTHHSLLHF